MDTNTFYQLWDVRGDNTRVIGQADTRDEAREQRRRVFNKNPKLDSSDVRLVQVTYSSGSPTVSGRFIR